MMIGVRRVGFLVLIMSSVLLATGARNEGAGTLDASSQAKPDAPDATQAVVTAKMAKLPLRFEANAGQWDPGVRFRARQGGATLFITDEGMTIGLRDVKSAPPKAGDTPDDERAAREKAQKEAKAAAVSINLLGAKPSPPNGEKQITTKSNFFIGSDPTKWRTNVSNYAEVRAQNWLPGVDVVWHGGDSGLEYDLEVAAGVDARKIELEVQGADSLHVNGDGALEIATAAGTLVQNPPRVVQNGRELAVHYHTDGVGRVGLEMETYDPSSAALVDPVLTYSTYLGRSGYDVGYGIAVDGSGNAYVTGQTDGSLPTTIGAFQTTYGGAFVTKLNAAGTALVYSTYLGGSGDGGNGIAVDGSGNAYVTGLTNGSFPTTSGSYQTTYGGGGGDAFITKLNAAGTALIYSTYLGGSSVEGGNSVAVDGSGNAYVMGQTNGGTFPTTAGAYHTTFGGGTNSDVFATKLNAAGTALVYSTYFGGGGNYGEGIAVDGNGNAYVAGYATGNFPTTAGAYQTAYGGGNRDAFVTKLNAVGTALVYSSYLGGSDDDTGQGIAVDGSGNAYVTGSTSGSFPTTTGAFQTTFGGGIQPDAFVTKLNATGTALVYSTYLGGGAYDLSQGIAIDGSGNAYVSGSTTGSFPTTAGTFPNDGVGTDDAFVAKLNAAGTALVYSTYLGGAGSDHGARIAVDGSGNAYITGQTSGSFPTTTGAFQPVFGGGSYDLFVAEIRAAATGTACMEPRECASDFCVDGFCCNTTCTGECQACDVTGHVGTCSPITGAPHGTRTACDGTGTCAGACDGTNTQACTYPGPNTVCGSTCSSGAETDSICDSAGDCAVQPPRSCNNFVCANSSTCKSTCSSAADCDTGFNCTDGTCQAAKCDDDHTSSAAEDCTPFKCSTSGNCKTQCASVDDCVSPSVCDPSGKCVAPPSSSGDSGGCSCDASSNGSSPWGTALITTFAAFILTRSRRRARITS